jgi:tRNA threonylcarbamoyladenosine biosynthesis protein TsaE
MTEALTLVTRSPEDTVAAGERFGRRLAAGTVVALVGPLGAGKTHFVKGVCRGLGVADPARVNSPTFVLVNEYSGRVPVFHLDAYRLRSEGELFEIGWDEMLESGGVVLLEWADRVPGALPAGAITVRFEPLPGDARRLEFSAPGFSDPVSGGA